MAPLQFFSFSIFSLTECYSIRLNAWNDPFSFPPVNEMLDWVCSTIIMRKKIENVMRFCRFFLIEKVRGSIWDKYWAGFLPSQD